MKHLISTLADPSLFADWFPYIGPMTLDPAIPALFNHVIEWGARKSDRFDIIHDTSKPIIATQALFHSLMAASEDEFANIGYDRRRFTFPLKAQSLVDRDSKLLPQLQVADICAGCINHYIRSRLAGTSDKLSDAIHDLNCWSWSVNTVMPGTEVTPEALGTQDDVGVNPVDPMARHLKNK